MLDRVTTVLLTAAFLVTVGGILIFPMALAIIRDVR